MSSQPVLPLPAFLQLVIQETTRDQQRTASGSTADDLTAWHDLSPRERSMVSQIEPADPVETAFRHRGWMSDRQRVLEALKACSMSGARIERFVHCGSGARVEVSAAGDKHRLRANYCHDRFCKPCAAARARVVRDNLLQWLEGVAPLFMTFTLRGDDRPLADVLDDLKNSFTRLRGQKLWKKAIKAAAAFVEITRGAKRDHWHVHLHVLADGSYIDKFELSEAWKKASNGSFIVDIRRVKDARCVVAYVAEYATKGFSREVLIDPEALVECLVALRGRRLLATYGRWGRLGMEDSKASEGDWRRVGRLVSIVAAAGRGEKWAVGCLKSLNVIAVFNAGVAEFLAAKIVNEIPEVPPDPG